MTDDFTRGRDDLSAAQAAIDAITPAITEAVNGQVDGLRAALRNVAKELAKKPNSHADIMKLQGRIVEAMGRVKIPNYADQLQRIEAKTTDLNPLMDKIDAIEYPEQIERPLKWRFDVVRNSNGLISEVIATAEDS